MKNLDLDFVKFILNLIIVFVAISIVVTFVLQTVSWIMLKLIIVEVGLISAWIWLEEEESSK